MIPGDMNKIKRELLNYKNSDNTLIKKVVNLRIVASLWFSPAIQMATGFNFYFLVINSMAISILVPKFQK